MKTTIFILFALATIGVLLWFKVYRSRTKEKEDPSTTIINKEDPSYFKTVVDPKIKRRYYCHGKIKRAGFEYDTTKKEIYSPQGRAYLNDHAIELRDVYGYRIITNPN